MQEKLYHTKNSKSNSNCPSCGFAIHHSHTFEAVLSGQYENADGGSYTAVRSTPSRSAEIGADVLVPAAQSLIWSVAVTLPSISVAMFMRWEWSAPLFIGATTILVSWISAMRRSEFSMMKTEEFSFSPAEGSGAASAGVPPSPTMKLEVIHETSGIRSRMQLMEIGGRIDEEKFGTFLRDVAAGKSTIRKNWTPVAKHFSKDDYDEIIEKLLLAEVLERAKNGSTRLTANGKRTIKALVRGGII